MDELSAVNLGARIELAHFRSKRTRKFMREFPPMEWAGEAAEPLPPISWAEIERQLHSLAEWDTERASWELEVLKASSRSSPPELFYRDLLTLAWSLIDGARPSEQTEAAMD